MRAHPAAHKAAGHTIAGHRSTDAPPAKNGVNHPAEAMDHAVPISAPSNHPGCFNRAFTGDVTTVFTALQ